MILDHLTEPNSNPTKMIIFHHPCTDGWMSAVIMHHHFGPGHCLYEGRNYDQPYDPAMLPTYKDKDVFILDFSMPLDNLREIAKVAQSVLVLDHHQSFAERLGFEKDCPKATFEERNLKIVYDVSRCGCELTWDYIIGERVNKPALVKYVADRDLWTWKLPCSREVSAALHLEERIFSRWNVLMAGLDNPENLHEYIQNGGYVLTAQRVEVEKLAKRAFMHLAENFASPKLAMSEFMKVVEPYKGKVIPVSNTQTWQSEVCEKMLELHGPDVPFAATFFYKDLKTRIWSLRSRKGSDVDVSALCKTWGGGGHKHAAGFTENFG